jgi:hypothetical protein
MTLKKDDILLLKAAIEFGSEYSYSIKEGGLGRTLVIDAGNRERAQTIRRKISTFWEGLYTLVIYNATEPTEEEKEESLYDPA